MNVFSMLEVKLTKLKLMTSDFIKGNHDVTFVFGLDSFKFQSRLIDFEYADMQKYFYALNNRMYCEYYKLFKIVSKSFTFLFRVLSIYIINKYFILN
jgi:hypothetical protein